jgi:hypothetical protein
MVQSNHGIWNANRGCWNANSFNLLWYCTLVYEVSLRSKVKAAERWRHFWCIFLFIVTLTLIFVAGRWNTNSFNLLWYCTLVYEVSLRSKIKDAERWRHFWCIFLFIVTLTFIFVAGRWNANSFNLLWYCTLVWSFIKSGSKANVAVDDVSVTYGHGQRYVPPPPPILWRGHIKLY